MRVSRLVGGGTVEFGQPLLVTGVECVGRFSNKFQYLGRRNRVGGQAGEDGGAVAALRLPHTDERRHALRPPSSMGCDT